MTTPSQPRAEAIEQAVQRLVLCARRLDSDDYPFGPEELEAFHEALAAYDAALALPSPPPQSDTELRVPAGHVRLPDGRDVKVIGKLVLTADGCLLGDGEFWVTKGRRGEPHNKGIPAIEHRRFNDVVWIGQRVYSSYENAKAAAMLAAREPEKGGQDDRR